MSKTPWYVKARRIAKDRKITYLDIAVALGITESAVGHYMAGRRSPNVAKIKRIAAVLETSLSELVEDDPYYLQNEKERELIDIYRQIPQDQRETAERILKSLIPNKPSE